MRAIEIKKETRELYESALIWDAHSGFMPDPVADLRNLQIWRDAGVDYLSIDVGFDLMPWQKTVETLAAFRRWILAHPADYVLVTRPQQIRDAKAQGRLAITFDVEGMNALDGRIEMVEFYHQLGVRQMLFAYNRNNLAGGGCHDDDSGLTEFGRQVIEEMNRLGMVVDVTHCGLRTSLEAMAHSKKPVIFSHSNVKALCGHGRNITDEQIIACARTGGIVSLVGLNMFLGDDDATSERLADHIEYVMDLAGPRHVGIGLDYGFPVDVPGIHDIIANNPEYWPTSEYGSVKVKYTSPAQLIEVAELLLRRNRSEQDVRGVLGENFFRVVGEVWR